MIYLISKHQWHSLTINSKNREKKIQLFDEKIKHMDKLENNITQLKDTVDTLQTRLDNIEKWDRLESVEILGVPEGKSEDLSAIISKLGNEVGVKISASDIVFATRVAQRSPTPSRPKPIVAKLARRQLKTDLISGMRRLASQKGGCQSSALNILGPSFPVYVNEHLTQKTKALLSKTKVITKDLGFRFTWVRNGKIFVRKLETSPAILINSEGDLEKLAKG
jgi:hypothetical protein